MQQPSVQKSQFGNLHEEATAKFDNKDCYAAAEETCYNIGWRSLDPYISSPMAWHQCIPAWQARAPCSAVYVLLCNVVLSVCVICGAECLCNAVLSVCAICGAI